MSTVLSTPDSGSPKRRKGTMASRAGKSQPRQADAMANETTPDVPWHRRTGVIALTGSVLMWAALPPLDLWPLAWVATVPWLLLVRQQELQGKRPYVTLWVAGFAFWLAAIHWIRLPHPALYLGWFALAFYLAFYTPVFIGLCRVAVHQLKLSIVVAAPVVWYGLELAKGHLLSGFTMGSLGHSQVHWLVAIQISDVLGSYAIGALVVFAAACVAWMWPWDTNPTYKPEAQASGQAANKPEIPSRVCIWPLAPLVAVMAAVLVYGNWRMGETNENPTLGPRIALIQGSFEVEVKTDRTMAPKINGRYLELSHDAVNAAGRQGQPVDLIVWPETMYRNSLFSYDKNFEIDPKWKDQKGKPLKIANVFADSRRVIADFSRALDTPWLTGVDWIHGNNDGRELHYNAAALVGRDGKVQGRYDKMHLVMFGEYIPLADVFPTLYDLTPVSGGAQPGEGPVSFAVGNARVAPNICYESTIPHVIRNHVVALRERGEEPDVLINVTNDGWFRGSSELDMHLACAQLRAVECRKPFLIAANTGLSAWIDANGNVVKQVERMQEGAIIAKPEIDHRRSVYLVIGDWPAAICLIFCCGLAVIGRRAKRNAPDQ